MITGRTNGPLIIRSGQEFRPEAAELHDETDGGHHGAAAANSVGRLTLMLLW